MKLRTHARLIGHIAACALICAANATAQSTAERAFPQSKAAIEKTVKSMTANLSGRLPVLEGFAKSSDHPLDRYTRGFYQATVQVESTPSGESIVRITAKLTAWYNDAATSQSGYRALASNGRIEQDLLDQLAEQLAATRMPAPVRASATPVTTRAAESPAPTPPPASSTNDALASVPSPDPDAARAVFSAAPRQPYSRPDPTAAPPAKADSALQAEADSLQEAVHNLAHPRNLVAVKKSGTPVLTTPSLTAKPQFLASMHDEFELLDFNADWVHVRISGLSRGWIWRNSVEMPEGIPDTDVRGVSALTAAADLFHVVREETAPFPGDWAPLRGKNVKILSVQKVDESSKEAGPQERLEYAKFLLDKNFSDIAKLNPAPKEQSPAGIVLIFDSADGGMIAATTATLQQWHTGKLSDAALWHNCFFDPPETFDSAGVSGSQ